METHARTLEQGRELPLALAILAQEHAAITEAFDRLEAAVTTAERADAHKAVVALARRHLELEERVFYPALDRSERMATVRRRNEAEHGELREALAALADGGNGGEVRLARLVFEHHRQGEETELFPMVERELGDQLAALAVELEQQREAGQGAYGVG